MKNKKWAEPKENSCNLLLLTRWPVCLYSKIFPTLHQLLFVSPQTLGRFQGTNVDISSQWCAAIGRYYREQGSGFQSSVRLLCRRGGKQFIVLGFNCNWNLGHTPLLQITIHCFLLNRRKMFFLHYEICTKQEYKTQSINVIVSCIYWSYLASINAWCLICKLQHESRNKSYVLLLGMDAWYVGIAIKG